MGDVNMDDILTQLAGVIEERRRDPQEGSYTNYLFDKGLDKILKKIGEECAETIVAAKNGDNAALTAEVCDVLYHLLVLMAERGLPLDAVYGELALRRAKIGNKKTMRETDHNT
jgi:phosphoribosyl-ATP pyrophosphohydrolase